MAHSYTLRENLQKMFKLVTPLCGVTHPVARCASSAEENHPPSARHTIQPTTRQNSATRKQGQIATERQTENLEQAMPAMKGGKIKFCGSGFSRE
ncbi:MAG TPA: hypothetical protein ENH21_00085 [Chromatiales bacterium]|nr:hypothetical protein [Chromatiales bacterium]HEX21810.1 hypothetical protein [Chromatiales bacterium]